MIGTKIENFRITSVLGEGGMGVVYKAFDLKLERYVALKILSEKAISNPQFVERFRREAKNQAQLSHPNIVPVFGFTDDRNMLGFVMEYVSGETLENIIERNGKIEVFDALEIMKQILGGASYAHSKGFIHRDLKPSNIIFTQDGIAKIMDFGISKSIYESKGITKSGVKIGTLLYMSPEQIKAYEPTQQSDIYALGIIFYEMLLGKNPFDGKSDFEIMEAHLKKYPAKLSTIIPGIPEEVDRIIFKALAKSTEKRYKNAEEFYNDIDLEITKYKSEQRKTREINLKKQQYHEKLQGSTYIKIGTGILISAILIYFSYTTVSSYLHRQKGVSENVNISDQVSSGYINSNWKRIASPVSASLTGVRFLNDIGIICGLDGTLLISNDRGGSWKEIPLAIKTNFYSLAGNGNFIFITAENGSLFRFDLNSTGLTEIRTSSREPIFSCYFLPQKSVGYACGGRGVILKTTNGGETWDYLNSKTNKLLYDIYFIDEIHGFTCGWDGEMLSTSDGGSNWSKMNLGTNNYLRKITFIDERSGFIVGGEGDLYKTTDEGLNWRKIETGISSGLYFISFINTKFGYILGSKGEILYTQNAGENWRAVQSGCYLPLTQIELLQDNSSVIVGYNGTILISRK